MKNSEHEVLNKENHGGRGCYVSMSHHVTELRNLRGGVIPPDLRCLEEYQPNFKPFKLQD